MIAYGCVAGIVHRELQPMPEEAPRPAQRRTRAEHGTVTRYGAGCRCAMCKAAKSEYRRACRERAKGGDAR